VRVTGLERRLALGACALAAVTAAAGARWGFGLPALTVVAVAVALYGFLIVRPLLVRVRLAEHDLEEIRRRHQGIVDNAVEGFFQTTPDGRYLTANAALARIYGFESPEQVVREIVDITRQLYVEPKRREEFVRALQERGQVVGFESRTSRRDGTMIWISENARAVRDADGRLLYYEGSVIDVTERKRAEEELRRSESELRRHRDHLEDMVEERTVRLKRLNARLEREIAERRRAVAELHVRDRAIASISEGIALTDPRQPDNPLVYVNSGFERLTGYARDEILGRNCRFLQGPDTDPAALDRLRTAIREERECVVELLNYRKDGSPFWNLLSITPVRDPDGELVSFIGVQFDITERKRIEALKDDLVSTVSHELRTPLASLRGFTELMLRRDFPRDKQREMLNVVHDESLRLTRLVNDFLDLQRIEAGRLGYRFAEVDVGAVVRDAVRLFAMQSDRHALRAELPELLPSVVADPDQLRRVLANLISNAVKFSPDGGEVTVGARLLGGMVRVTVSDRGIGIEADAIDGLFRKFHRLEAGKARHIGGTGLGLALVRRIVEAHGGRVGATSEPGAGSTFWFTVPVVDAVRTDAAAFDAVAKKIA